MYNGMLRGSEAPIYSLMQDLVRTWDNEDTSSFIVHITPHM